MSSFLSLSRGEEVDLVVRSVEERRADTGHDHTAAPLSSPATPALTETQFSEDPKSFRKQMILTSTSFHKSDCCKTGNVKIIFPISEAAAFLDNEILNIQNSLPGSIAAARASKAQATRQENVLGVSYGTAIVGANVAYTASQIWDKNLTEWQYPDWGTLMANKYSS